MLDHPKLTARQQQILDLIQVAISRTGAPPTRAEIATELGFKSANAAEEHLQALARKGLQVLFCGVGRLEAQLGGDFGPCRRRAGAGNSHLDQVQDLLLAGGELGMVEHGVSGACHSGGG